MLEEHPFQSLMIEEFLGNIKRWKKDLIQKLLSDDAKELISCLEVGAYKACMILCGSILETILLDWLSELEKHELFC